MRRVCVVIPAYNEATVIGEVVKSAREVFLKSKKAYDIDIVVVNDGSKDETANEAT